MLAGLACGTPVIYVGAGPAGADITENRLGLALPYDREVLKMALTSVLEGRLRTGQTRKWVQEHRSLRLTGQNAARVVLAQIRH